MKIPAVLTFDIGLRRKHWVWRPTMFGEWGGVWSAYWLCLGIELVWP